MIYEAGNDRCYFCGGRLENDLVTVPFMVGRDVVIVKKVPASVCTQCGEPILNSEVAVNVDQLLKQAYQSGFEVSVVSYSAPELILA